MVRYCPRDDDDGEARRFCRSRLFRRFPPAQELKGAFSLPGARAPRILQRNYRAAPLALAGN